MQPFFPRISLDHVVPPPTPNSLADWIHRLHQNRCEEYHRRVTMPCSIAEALKLDSTQLRKMTTALKNPGVKNLHLFVLSLDLATVAAEVLRTNSAIYSFEAAVRDAAACALIVGAVKANTTLQSLSLRGGGLTDATLTALAEALQNSSTLQSLSLSGPKIGEETWIALARTLQSTAALQKLCWSSRYDVGGHAGRFKGTWEASADLVQGTAPLQDFTFSGRAACLFPLQALQSSRKLAILTFHFTIFQFHGDAPIISLAQALRVNATLHDFSVVIDLREYLGVNNILETICKAFAETLQANTTLRSFSLSTILKPPFVDDATSVALAGALCTNSTLQKFEYAVEGGKLSNAECLAFEKVFHTNMSLKQFRAPLPMPHYIRCLEAVNRNRNIPMIECVLHQMSIKTTTLLLKQTLHCPGIMETLLLFFMPVGATLQSARSRIPKRANEVDLETTWIEPVMHEEPPSDVSPEEAEEITTDVVIPVGFHGMDEVTQVVKLQRESFVEHGAPARHIIHPERDRQAIVLTFGWHSTAFRDTLLTSSLGRKAMKAGAELQPGWANGAVVLVPGITQETWQESTFLLELSRKDVIVYPDDMNELTTILAKLFHTDRPRLKTGAPRTEQPAIIDVFIDVPSDDASACVGIPTDVASFRPVARAGSFSSASTDVHSNAASLEELREVVLHRRIVQLNMARAFLPPPEWESLNRRSQQT